MKLSLQQKKMKEIYELLSQNLSYIFGERESGPNGAKQVFLRKSAAFLRQLGKDLEFSEMMVNTNPAGIAVSGEVALYGMWGEDNGVYFRITQSAFLTNLQLYREIKSLKDYTGGCNQWMSDVLFREMDYRRLCDTLLEFKRKGAEENAA